jgi:hypothetical protein
MEAGLAVEGLIQLVDPGDLRLTPFRGKGAAAGAPMLTAEAYSGHDPILGYEDEVGNTLMIDGQRRAELARAKGVPKVQFINLGRISEQEVLTLLLRTGITHVERDPFEGRDQVLALQKIRPELDSARKLEPVVGVSHTRILELLRLAHVAPETRFQYESNKITRTELDQFARVREPKAQVDLVLNYVNGVITRADVLAAVAAANGTRTPRAKPKGKSIVLFDRDWEIVHAQLRHLQESASAEQRLDLARRLRAEAEAIEKSASAGEGR